MTDTDYAEDILKQLKALTAEVAALKKAVLSRPSGGGSGGAPGAKMTVQPATRDDLTSKYGNPDVRKDPGRWVKDGGESYVGRPFSECPPAYLRELADLYLWMAGKRRDEGEGQAKVDYALRDAARALGWAREAELAELGQDSLCSLRADKAEDTFGSTDDLPF